MIFSYDLDSFAINDVEVSFVPGSLQIENIGNGRRVLRAQVRSYGIGVGPLLAPRIRRRHSCVLVLDGATEFDGVIWETRETRVFENKGILQTITAVDWGKVTERVLINAPVPSNSLEGQLTQATNNVTTHFNITVSPDQEPGPTLGNDLWEFQTIRQVYERLSANSGWVTRFDGLEVRMVEPGVTPAPFTINDVDEDWTSLTRYGSLEDYWNEVCLRYGPQGQLQVTEDLGAAAQTLSGDPSGLTFRLAEYLNLEWINQQVAAGLATVEVHRTGGITTESLDADPDAGTADWHYAANSNYDNNIIQDGGTPLNTAAGEFVRIVYQANFPNAVFARNDEVLTFGQATALVDAPSITDKASAQSIAEGRLRQIEGENEYVEIITYRKGLEPFQSLTVEVDDHDLDGDFLILTTYLSHVARTSFGKHVFQWRVVAVEGNAYKLNWEQFYKANTTPTGTGGGAAVLNFGCVGGETIFFDDWNAVATPQERWTSGPNTPGTLQLTTNGIGGSQCVERVDINTFGQQVLNKTLGSEIRQGCLEFRYKSDGGSTDTQIFGLSDANVNSRQLSFKREQDPFTSNNETLKINLTTWHTGFQQVITLHEQDLAFNLNAFDWWRVEFKISTWNGSAWLQDAYVRVYKNGALILNAENIFWGNQTGSSTLGINHLQFRCQGPTDNVVLRATDTIGVSSSVSPSLSRSPSSSLSPSSSASPSPGNSPSQSPSQSPSSSVSPSQSPSQSASVSPSSSQSASPSPTPSASASVSPSGSAGFPGVLGVAHTLVNSDSTAHVINLPPHQAGETIVVFFAVDDNPTVTIDAGSTSGWASMASAAGNSNLCRGHAFKLVTSGSGSTLQLNTSSAQQSTAAAYRTDGSDAAGAAVGGSTNANPPNLTPGGGALDYLWLVGCASDSGTNSPSAAPTNFDEMRKQLGGGGGATITTAERELNASSLDPGAFTNGLISTVAITVAVFP